jgi:tRNA(Ile)-lysidine synthase TilS/MesJ
VAAIAFDTLKFANRLKQAGVPPQQAEAEAAAFAEVLEISFKELATKEDLRLTKEELRRDLKDLEMRIEAKMDRLDAKIDKLEAKVDRLDTRLTGELTLVKWMLGLLLGGCWPLFSKPFFQSETMAA